MRFFFPLLASILLFSGCSSKSPAPKSSVKLKPYKQTKTLPYKLKKKTPITLALYDQYKKWYKTPYKYGGETCYGVDCSALVQLVYKDAFGVKIPRSTKLQEDIGYFVKQQKLRAGDLILFKTGSSKRHSGIYIESGNFLHTSTKYGVTVSNLNNPYWREKYWQARRVLSY